MKIINRKRFAAAVAVVMLLMLAVGGTIAYLIARTDPLVNAFSPAKVDVSVTDTVAGNVKSNVVITNTGNIDAYIRARIVGNWVDENGIIVQGWNPEGDGAFTGLPGSDWKMSGDYYYYTKPVAPDATTSPLFDTYTVTRTVDGARLVLDIMAQAVQADGGAAADAWQLDPSALP